MPTCIEDLNSTLNYNLIENYLGLLCQCLTADHLHGTSTNGDISEPTLLTIESWVPQYYTFCSWDHHYIVVNSGTEKYHTWHNLFPIWVLSCSPKRELQILTINSRSLQLAKLNGRSYFKYLAGTLMIYGFTDIWSSKSHKIKQLSYGLRELENVILSYLAQKLRQSL